MVAAPVFREVAGYAVDRLGIGYPTPRPAPAQRIETRGKNPGGGPG
jgi:hypothetical protein